MFHSAFSKWEKNQIFFKCLAQPCSEERAREKKNQATEYGKKGLLGFVRANCQMYSFSIH